MAEKTKLFTLLADYPNTLPLKRGEVSSDFLEFEFADIKVANSGFKPFVREAKFDFGELAIVTFLQAKSYGKPYVLLPATVVARDQHHTIAYNPKRGDLAPADLAGKRVGIRSYSVTTSTWIRGILHQQYGLDLDRVHWITFEEPHVAEFKDPSSVTRAEKGKDMVQMLLDGELDAAVVGDKLPDPRLKMLFSDPGQEAASWREAHGLPINHMAIIRSELSREKPDVAREAFRMLKESSNIAARAGNAIAARMNFGVAENARSLETIIDIVYEQGLIPRRYGVEELFDSTTRDLK